MVGGGSLEPSLLPSLNPPGVPTPGGGCSGSSKVQRPPVSHTPAHSAPVSSQLPGFPGGPTWSLSHARSATAGCVAKSSSLHVPQADTAYPRAMKAITLPAT